MNSYSQESFDFSYGGNEVPLSQPEELQKLTPVQRLGFVVNGIGMVPSSKKELTRAMSALEHRDSAGGFASHLNEILLHQNKAKTNDPRAALRSVLSEVGSYASTARGNVAMLGTLECELADRDDLVPSKSVANNGLSRDLLRVPATRRAIGHMLRSRQVDIALRENELVDLNQAVDDEQMAVFLQGIRLSDFKHGVDVTRRQQQNRFDFWTDQLEASTRHSAVRAMAFAALEKCGVHALA